MTAPEPDTWIPMESLETLPELEELLDPRYLVDSGQTRTIKVDKNGRGLVLVDQDIADTLEFEHNAKRRLSRKRWISRRRTLFIKRRNRIVKFACLIGMIVAILVGGLSFFLFIEPTTPQISDRSFTHTFMPTQVPVLLEGNQKYIFTVADNLDELLLQNNWTGLEPQFASFNRTTFEVNKKLPPLDLRYPKVTYLNVDNSSQTILTSALSVADALKDNGVIVNNDDIVTPALNTPMRGTFNISVTRVSTSTRIESHTIGFITEKQNDPTLLKGKTTIKREGQNGSVNVTYTQMLHDGVVANEVESSRVITKEPISKIILVGTKAPQSQTGKATFYSAPSGTCAHKSLPIGTIVTVTNTATGASVSCRISDRGPFGEGRVIDLSREGFSSIAPISQGVVSVSLSW